jgi:hypothetical protein
MSLERHERANSGLVTAKATDDLVVQLAQGPRDRSQLKRPVGHQRGLSWERCSAEAPRRVDRAAAPRRPFDGVTRRRGPSLDRQPVGCLL